VTFIGAVCRQIPSVRRDVAAWHHGWRFWACHCGNRVETIDGSTIVQCDGCNRTDMEEWVPPAVARERERGDGA
jgi:hypothetical protein